MDDRKANPDYLSVIQKKYIKKLGEIKEVDFTYNAQSVKNKINKKVEKVTRGKIKNLLSQVDESTLVIVLSANGLTISKIYPIRENPSTILCRWMSLHANWKGFLPIGYNKQESKNA
jgi:hypothetical protein